ncbi:MAG: hypothetical protein P1U63_04340 [Coxiellaceae bacterium]|nr:hypothetical protein [Coxiellaceae bacterium]
MRSCLRSSYRVGVRVGGVSFIILAAVASGACGAAVGAVAGLIAGGAMTEPGIGAAGGAGLGFLAGSVMGASYASRALRKFDSESQVSDLTESSPSETLMPDEDDPNALRRGLFC